MFLNLFKDNSEALSLLDWPQVIVAISSLSHFELTQKRISHPPKLANPENLQKDLDILQKYIESFESFSFVFNSSMRMLPVDEQKFQLIKDIKKGKFFEAEDLNFFALLFENYLDNFITYQDIAINQDYLVKKEDLSNIRRNFLNPLREFVDKSGAISYENHPQLRILYKEIVKIEQELRVSITQISKSDLFSSKLQMDNFDIVNDRYVLAIRSDSYASNLGSIIARSHSGMTLFVEPFEMREKSNRRLQLLSEIESIILKLTIDISKVTHLFPHQFLLFSLFPLEIDWINTKATYCIKLGLVKPNIVKKFSVTLDGLFHPLLTNPIRNSINLKYDHKGLIISGPNTGGKTVALKSLCLSYLFLNLGLFVPATYAELYPAEGLFYFSHDHQNLAEGLSSFASESKYYLQLLNQLESHNLIIIDEIFNSTSSEEASALAMAFLDEIHLRSNSKVIISTHHQVLKTFMHAKNDYLSAHVGFDFDLNRPTYKLIIGEPGSSLAFKIFDNLSLLFGHQSRISDRARDFLDQKQINYEVLLQELSSKKIEQEKLINSNKLLNIELKNQKSSMEGVLYLEKEKIYNEYLKKIKRTFSEAEELLKNVKEEKTISKRNLTLQISKIQSDFNKHGSISSISPERVELYDHLLTVDIKSIKTPLSLFSINLRKNVIAINVNLRKNEIQIQNGALSLWVNPLTLRLPSGTKSTRENFIINIDRSTRGDIEIDCRGMRLEEFQKACFISIEEVENGDIPFITIIHGHGDGVLKSWLRSHLKKSCANLNWQNEEGNDGCTKITLK